MPSQILLNNVLSFNPQSRHSTHVHPYLYWDLRNPAESARSADTGHKISPRVRAHFATNPPVKVFRITCGLFPSSSWNIDISNPHGVTVDDVLRGLHQGLRRRISSSEWARIPRQNQSRVAEAFYDRQRHSSDPQYEHSSGVRRIDWLLKHSSFVGLSPSVEQPYTWTLTTRRINSH